MDPKASKRVLAAIPDLFFGSKVAAAAGRLGIRVEFATSRQALAEGIRSRPDLVVIDLDAPTTERIEAIRAACSRGNVRLVAFASHVHGARLDEARDSGCEEVLTRAKLASTLPALLASL